MLIWKHSNYSITSLSARHMFFASIVVYFAPGVDNTLFHSIFIVVISAAGVELTPLNSVKFPPIVSMTLCLLHNSFWLVLCYMLTFHMLFFCVLVCCFFAMWQTLLLGCMCFSILGPIFLFHGTGFLAMFLHIPFRLVF